MFRWAERRNRERDEIMLMHAKIAAIHADMVRRDEELRLDLRTRRELIAALDRLTSAAERAEVRSESESELAGVLRQMLAARMPAEIDLTDERVLGGSVRDTRGVLPAHFKS
jgi:hypothetical protein